MNAHYAADIAAELGLPPPGVDRTLELLADEATIPFIARYRKEATGNLDEVQIAAVRDLFEHLRKLDERKQTILKSIEQQGKLTDELREKIAALRDAARLEDLYLPFKPKRKTRATEAVAKGLEPLAELIWKQEPPAGDPAQAAVPFVNPEKGVADEAAAWQGARDIVAEWAAEHADARAAVREFYLTAGLVASKVKPGRERDGAKFRDYHSFSEPAKNIPSHRMLAIRRGESEGFLTYRVQVDRDKALALIKRAVVRGDGAPFAEHLFAAIEDGYDRLMAASIEGQARNELRKRADKSAIAVFAKNLRRLLMAAPLGPRWVLGVDPGIRTGCKIAALDGKGDLLASTVIDLQHGAEKAAEARATVENYCRRYQVEAIAIGNGTGGRETDAFFRALDRETLNDAPVVLVSEAGASVYSASDIARQEFPDLDVSMRGAISIARRLQDPLAELVKIEPRSIGVGQYQHDVDQDDLKVSLDEVVQSCVNAVGVDLNTASPQLLSYVSGLNASQAQALVKQRTKVARFTDRQQILQTPGIGPKTFQMAAGFLRIRGGNQPLDASAVHPERYELVARMAADLEADVSALLADAALRARIDPNKYVGDDVGLPTLNDILAELARPGRDPRDKFEAIHFDPNVTEIAHLQEGMTLEGVVANITDFGAFVDVGVHQPGLVHMSELAWSFIEDAGKVVSVGEHVRVKVIGVDRERKRISLSIKQLTPAPKRPEPPPRPPRPPRPPQDRPRDDRPRPERPAYNGPRDDRPRPDRPRDDRPRPDRPDRRPDRRDDRPPIKQQPKPRYDSPFAGLFMEGGVIKMKDDPKKKPPKQK